MLGDLNAQLDKQYLLYPASYSVTDNGDRLADFFADTNMQSSLCHMRKPRSQWFTHQAPKGFLSRIDYYICRNSHACEVLNCSLHSPLAPASDHKLLVVDTCLCHDRQVLFQRSLMRNLAALVETEKVKASVARVIKEAAPGAYSQFATAAR